MYPFDDLYPVVLYGAETAAVLALVVTLALRRRTTQTVPRSRLAAAAWCFGGSAMLVAPHILRLLGFPAAQFITSFVLGVAWLAVPIYTLATVLLFAAGVGWCVAAAQPYSGSREGTAWR